MSATLSKRAAFILYDSLEQIARMSNAITTITQVLEVAHVVQHASTCEVCAEEHRKLSSGYITSGLNDAVGIIAAEISYQVDRFESVIDEEGVVLVEDKR